jgi:DNA polymerase-3 subunit delta
MQYKTDSEIIKDIKAGTTYPVYFLMGDESFYIDKIADYIQDNLLSETDREFDQQVLYGDDVTMEQVVDAAKQFPMMAKRQVIILREAQLIKKLDSLAFYVQKPLESTILVVVYRKSLDKRSKLYKNLKSTAAVFESNKLRDYEVLKWIPGFVRGRGYTIDDRSALLLADSLGTDLSKIANEVEKLLITMPKGKKSITAEHIERNIGISKDFNSFELQDALATKNVLKANRIIDYFAKNPKKNPMVLTLASLFGFFSNLMVIHYLPNKSPDSVAGALRMHPFIAKKTLQAAKVYPAGKVFRIIAMLREYDARAKGVGNSSVNHGELLKELIFKITH